MCPLTDPQCLPDLLYLVLSLHFDTTKVWPPHDLVTWPSTIFNSIQLTSLLTDVTQIKTNLEIVILSRRSVALLFYGSANPAHLETSNYLALTLCQTLRKEREKSWLQKAKLVLTKALVDIKSGAEDCRCMRCNQPAVKALNDLEKYHVNKPQFIV